MGVNWGVPCELLAYQMGGFRNGLAVSLPHDILVRNWSDDLLLSQSLWKLMDDFGRAEASFTPYYSRECPVQGLPKDWIASVYRHPNHGALIIVSNLSRQEGRATLKPDRKALASTCPAPSWMVLPVTRCRRRTAVWRSSYPPRAGNMYGCSARNRNVLAGNRFVLLGARTKARPVGAKVNSQGRKPLEVSVFFVAEAP